MAEKPVLAAGFIVFRRQGRHVEYLVLKHCDRLGGNWGTPKGHLKKGETAYKAALRETKEETGLTEDQMDVLDDFKTELKYRDHGKPKTVEYWLSKVKDPDVSVTLCDEHTEYKWAALEEACHLLHFESMIKAVRDADRFINN